MPSTATPIAGKSSFCRVTISATTYNFKLNKWELNRSVTKIENPHFDATVSAGDGLWYMQVLSSFATGTLTFSGLFDSTLTVHSKMMPGDKIEGSSTITIGYDGSFGVTIKGMMEAIVDSVEANGAGNVSGTFIVEDVSVSTLGT